MTEEQQDLEAIAANVVARCQAHEVDMQEAARNRTGALRVNENPKVSWTFKEEGLEARRGGQSEKQEKVKKSTLLRTAHAVTPSWR